MGLLNEILPDENRHESRQSERGPGPLAASTVDESHPVVSTPCLCIVTRPILSVPCRSDGSIDWSRAVQGSQCVRCGAMYFLKPKGTK